MTRPGFRFFCVMVGSAALLVGCGSNTPSGGAGGTIQDLIPGNNTITGWTIDPGNSKTAGQVAAFGTAEQTVENLIDGAAADFFAPPATPTNFAWQNYVNVTLPDAPVDPAQTPQGATLKLYVLQMPSEAQAAGLYTSLLSANLYVGNTWTDPTTPAVGTKSRVTNSGTDWWINFYKGVYYVEVRMTPSFGPAPNYTPNDASLETVAFTFATAITSKI
jgi:hypothetical protein